MTLIADVIRLILQLASRQAFHTNAVPFYEQPIRGRSFLCKPIGAKIWPSTSSRPTISTSVNTTWRTACPIDNFMECSDYANFLYLIPILRRFRIIKQQAALHSALFKNTPLVIRGTDKNKQLTIIKPTQTGINRNKYPFLHFKIIGAP